MRPCELVLKGFACFREEQRVSFQKLELFAISGPTGSGKSTLLDAIVFALYGKIPRTGKQGAGELISLGLDRLSVRFDFAVSEKMYRVIRIARRSGAGSAQLETVANGSSHPVADGIRLVNEALEEILGLGYDAFLQSVLLPQGQFARFLKSAPRERRQILRTLLRLQVYEEMRKRAEERRALLDSDIKGLEKRLHEDYGGATEAALAASENDLENTVSALEESREALEAKSAARAEVEKLWSTLKDLATARTRLESHEAEGERVTEIRETISRGRRALPVVPLAEAITPAQREVEEAEESRKAADHRMAESREATDAASRTLKQAQAAAEETKSLRDQIDKLAGVIELLGPLRNARKERDQAQTGLADLLERLAAQKGAQADAAERSETEGSALRERAAERAELGYDAEAHEALRGAAPTASRLGDTRSRLDEARKEHSRDDARLAQAKKAAVKTGADVEKAQGVVAERETELEKAEATLREVEHRNLAHTLRDDLVPGQPCPVCAQSVSEIPDEAAPTDVRKARRTRDAAEASAVTARSKREKATASHTASEAEQKAAAEAAAASETRVTQLASETDDLEAELNSQVKDLIKVEAALPLEVAVQAASEEAAQTAAADARLREEEEASQTRLKSAEADADKARALITELDGRRSDLEARVERLEKEVANYQADIHAVTDADDPAAERDSLRSRVEAIQEQLTDAQEAATEAEKILAQATVAAQSAAERADAAQKRLEAVSSKAEEAARAAGFDSSSDALAAALAPEELKRNEKDVREFDQEQVRLRDRAAKLAEAAGDTQVTEADVAKAHEVENAAKAERDKQLNEQGSLAARIAQLKGAIGKAKELAAEREEKSARHSVHHELAAALRSDRFQSYLLTEAFARLVQGASETLLELSDQRYTLEVKDDDFRVVDHDNARETRSADTLSGGETFLASLALALQLSEQVQQAAGAIKLDSIFIDEGFGTLDAETLDVVAGAIEGLRDSNRTVGIITHVRALASRMPMRIDVTKAPEGSRIELLEA